MIIIKIEDNKLNPEHADFNATLSGLAFMAELRNAQKETVGDTISYFITEEKLSLDLAKTLHGLGVIIENMPLFIDTSVACPFSYEDEEGETVDHTWTTWKLSNHTFMDNTTDEKVYLGSNAGSNEDLTIAELYEAGLEDSVIDTATLRGLIINEE